MRHHLKFRNFRPSIVQAAEDLFEAKPWSIDDDREWEKVAQAFCDAVSNAYGVRTAVVEADSSYTYRRRRGVRYEPAQVEHSVLSAGEEMTEVAPPKILVKNQSIISLFKGVRIHALAQGDLEAVSIDDPWAWACSLFYTVRPIMFRARARQGRIKDVTARDTYSSETWDRMVEAGVTRGDSLAYDYQNFDPRTLESQVSDSDLEEFVASTDDDNLPDEEETDVDPEVEPGHGDMLAEAILAETATDPSPADDDSDDSSPLPRVADMNRDAVRALAAQWRVPERGTLNRDQLAAKLVELGLAR